MGDTGDALIRSIELVEKYLRYMYILYGQAKKAMNGTDLDGKKVRVDYSITKRAHTPTPGMYMGRSVFAFSASLLRIWTMLLDREIF